MEISSNIAITSVTLINSKVLQVQFNVDWTIEDTAQLTQKLLSLTAIQVIDVTQGADIETTRVKFDNSEFLLTFEEYSHSCWLECISDEDCQGLLTFQENLNRNVNH